jgi:hypothetical protein
MIYFTLIIVLKTFENILVFEILHRKKSTNTQHSLVLYNGRNNYLLKKKKKNALSTLFYFLKHRPDQYPSWRGGDVITVIGRKGII